MEVFFFLHFHYYFLNVSSFYHLLSGSVLRCVLIGRRISIVEEISSYNSLSSVGNLTLIRQNLHIGIPFNLWRLFNSLWPSGIIWHGRPSSSLDHVRGCCLVGTNALNLS